MSVGVGLVACAISSLFFGSMFVPLRNYAPPRDGIFAQWLMSIAILLVGFVVFAFSAFPGFYPLAMLGGASWCIGNATAIPIISRLGMAISILIWNTTNCITGWAGGRFGLFGMNANPPASPTLNYLGLVCVVVGGVLFSRVESGPSSSSSSGCGSGSSEKTSIRLDEPEMETDQLNPNEEEEEEEEGAEEAKIVVKTSRSQRFVAFVAALIAGVFYGMTFVPVIHMIDNPDRYPNQPTDGISYVFSHYFGIFITSTLLFIIYAILKKNKPYTPSSLCLPGLCSGFLWAVAQTSFFVANQHLSQAVTFPIITMMPGCIASAWSIFYYKEIRGRHNFILLSAAMLVTLCGAMFVGLSKSIEI